ncbi:MAG TPA: AI-2E family transporter [bacterium]|mgnify:CR=1 FL=1|nr:AI-2E family transporter [bacterium]HQG44871.1 AI-2E family transporter [bacterium]HQI47391.1 AI-2E family transporter [bacterium]HQJ63007.1 AI-2E family transporter [bacterium]
MSFAIHLTSDKLRQYGTTAVLAAALLLVLWLAHRLSPALLRLILLTLFLMCAIPALPRPRLLHRARGVVPLLTLAALYVVLDLGIAGSIGTSRPAASASSLHGDAGLLQRQLDVGRIELLEFLHGAGQLLWPAPGTVLLGLLLAGLLAALWPKLATLLLRRAGNSTLNRRAWQLRELPRRFGAWVRCETLHALLLGVIWGCGTWLLGYSHPVAAALLMSFASPTPFWGPLLAAGLSLFFAAGVRQLLLQAGGAVIVFAVAWLASHLLLASRLDASRPRLPRGALLLCALGGYALAGIGGFFFAAPLLTTTLHLRDALRPPDSAVRS